jgi:hypothetical protein
MSSKITHVDKFGIMKAICILANQTYLYNRQLKKMVVGEKVDEKTFGQKRRLFSDIEISAQKGVFTINSVDHKFPIKSIVYSDSSEPQLILNSEIMQFNKTVEIDESKPITFTSNLEQTAYFNLKTGIIKIVLKENTKQFNYVSNYKYFETSGLIKLDPYTKDPHKIVKPVRRYRTLLTHLNGPVVNIYKYLNRKTSGNQVTIGSQLSELKAKLSEIEPNIKVIMAKPTKHLADKAEIAQYNFVADVLTNDKTREEFDNKLRKWKNDYDNWAHKRDNILPIEQHEYKFEYVPAGKEKLSRTMERLINRLKPYDAKIILEHDTETITIKEDNKEVKTVQSNISKPINYGVYTPYLVSDIIRFKNEFFDDTAVDTLALSADNIKEFCEFIHGFKSVLFTTISLYRQLLNIKLTHECAGVADNPRFVINFEYANLYNKMAWVKKPVKSVLNHQLLFKPCETITNCLQILAKPASQQIMKQELITVDEPLFGNIEFTKVDDFDEMYNSILVPTVLDSITFNLFGGPNLSKNYENFFIHRFQYKEELRYEADEDRYKELNVTDDDFPVLNKVMSQKKSIVGKWLKPLNLQAIASLQEPKVKASSPKPYGQIRERKQRVELDEEDDEEPEEEIHLVGKSVKYDAYGDKPIESDTDRHKQQLKYKPAEQGRKHRKALAAMEKARKAGVSTPQSKLAKRVEELVSQVMNKIQRSKMFRSKKMDEISVEFDIREGIRQGLIKSDTSIDDISEMILNQTIKSLLDTEDLDEQVRQELARKVGSNPESASSETRRRRKANDKAKGKTKTKRDLLERDLDWKQKYLKYKTKYLKLKNLASTL